MLLRSETKKPPYLPPKYSHFPKYSQFYLAFQIQVPLYHLSILSHPAIHAATHEKNEAYRPPSQKLRFHAGHPREKSSNCWPQQHIINSHHPIFRKAREAESSPPSLVRSRPPEASASQPLYSCKDDLLCLFSFFFFWFLFYVSLAVCSRPDSLQSSKATAPTN
jgi:hypothetical protein